jgi:CBS domain-containing protein
MSVGRICTRVVVTAEPGESVAAAARRMAEHDVGTLAVLDPAGRALGIATDRDIALFCVGRGQDPEKLALREIMSGPPVAVRESTPIENALAEMAAARVRRVLVLGDDDALIGILALDDVLELLAEEFRSIGRLLAAERGARAPAPPH